ncbi:hypothetical protein EVAR_70868_1, partial [Eumeta japonica]
PVVQSCPSGYGYWLLHSHPAVHTQLADHTHLAAYTLPITNQLPVTTRLPIHMVVEVVVVAKHMQTQFGTKLGAILAFGWSLSVFLLIPPQVEYESRAVALPLLKDAKNSAIPSNAEKAQLKL